MQNEPYVLARLKLALLAGAFAAFSVSAILDAPALTRRFVNLAMVVRNWGPAGATLQINGQSLPRGAQFRYGHRHELEGSTLLVWIRYDATDPMTIQLTPEPL